MSKINPIKDKFNFNMRFLLLFLFLIAGKFSSYAQLSDLHYLPPLKQAGVAFDSQAIYLSTPETTAFSVDIYQGTSTTKLTSIIISKTVSGKYTLAIGGDNDITLLTAANTGIVQSTAGLRFESPTGKKFYVNWRGKSQNQTSSLTTKGRAALGKSFKWGGVPNKGLGYGILNASVGIMATADNTTVRIFGYNPNCTFRLGAIVGGITDNDLTITLNAGQTYVLEAPITEANSVNIDGWLGASITTDKDIAVSIGEMHFQPSVDGYQDCGIDQIIPENILGKEYIFVRGNGPNSLEFPVIVATQNNTEIYINGSATPVATINNGQYYSIPSTYYSQNSTTASVPGANMYVRSSKEVYAFQSLAGGLSTATPDINFIPPINWLLSNKVDNIPDISSIAGAGINAGITIIASTSIVDADIVVKNGINGTTTVPLASLVNAKRTVAGTSDWKTYYLSGLTGNVSVNATGPIAVGFFGFSGNAGVSGYFSGFETIPTINVQPVGDGCLPSTILSVPTGFASYQWKKNGVNITGATTNTYIPPSAGSFTVVLSNGVSFYETAVQSVFDCHPEIIVTTTADKNALISGETAVFKVTVKYLGVDRVTNLVVNTVLPAHLTYVSSKATSGTVTGGGSNYFWNIGTMNNDEERVLTITTTANAVGSLTNEIFTVSKTQTLSDIEINKVADDFTEDVSIYGACDATIAGTLSGAASVCEGINSTTLQTTNYVGTIQWQKSNNNTTFVDIVGATTASLIQTNVSSTTYYRIKAQFGTCTKYATSIAITVNSLPNLSAITGPNKISPAVLNTYTNVTTGGTWTSSNSSIASVNTNGEVFGYSGGNANIIYTYTDLNGCSTSVSKAITVVQRPMVSKNGQMITAPNLVTNRNGAKGYGGGRSKNGELIAVPTTPVVITGTVSVSGSTATISSILNATGAITVSEMGICYSTTALPTVDNTKITSTAVLGNFATTVPSLVINTTYYARAYATNALGTTYGNQVSFTSSAADGLTAASASTSAWAIKRDYPLATDGLYWIKNPNINGGNAFQIYADMTTDGGGWTLILTNAVNSGWTIANAIHRVEGVPSLSANYSIVDWADYIKKSPSGFQYMIEATTRGDWGGIWTANRNYSFVATNNSQTEITLNTKFGVWDYSWDSIEARMPWYTSNGEPTLTTNENSYNDSAWWGTLVTTDLYWSPAPWIGYQFPSSPGVIWYWVR